MLKRMLLFASLGAAVISAVSAASAQAGFSRHIYSGSVGGFYSSYFSPQIEGGICNDPGVPFATCSNGPNSQTDYYNQIFLNTYAARTNPSSVAQNIQSYAYLYYYSTANGWVRYRTWNMGTCANKTGAGQGSCFWGSPAEDQIGGGSKCLSYKTASGAQACRPYFINLDPGPNKNPPGYSWSVTIRVIWRNASTSTLLGYADYIPTTNSDMGCASFANYVRHRCAPGNFNGREYLYMH